MRKRLVITLGTFDLPHPGHVFLFEQCRQIAGPDGHVSVSVNPDDFVERFKGSPPVMTEDERLRVIRGFRDVDTVYVNQSAEDGGETIDNIMYDYDHDQTAFDTFLVIGTDWAPPKDYYGQLGIDQAWLGNRGICMIYIPRFSYYSSSDLKERIVKNG